MIKRHFILFGFAFALLLSCSKEDTSFTSEKGKSGSITRFATVGNYLYTLDQNQVIVYNITQHENPIRVTSVKTDYGLETIIEYDGTIYVGSRTALYILDITNPAIPFVVGKSERESFQRGCDPVVVKGNYAYSTIKVIGNICGSPVAQSVLIVYDVSDKSNPVNVNSITMDQPNGVGIDGNFLFVCDEGKDVIQVYNISTPALPALVSSIALTDPVDVIISNKRMIASAKTAFVIFDISDVSSVKKLSSISKN